MTQERDENNREGPIDPPRWVVRATKGKEAKAGKEKIWPITRAEREIGGAI